MEAESQNKADPEISKLERDSLFEYLDQEAKNLSAIKQVDPNTGQEATLPSFTTEDGMKARGLLDQEGNATQLGEDYILLEERGLLKDGIPTLKGKAFSVNKDDLLDPTSWLDAGMTDEALDVEKANMLAIRKNSGIDAEPEKSIGESFKEFGQGLASIGKGAIELAAEAFDPKDESKIPEAIDSFIETAVTSGAKLTRSIDRERLKAAAAMGNIPKEEADKLNVLRDYKLALIEKSQKDMDAVETASLVGLGENVLRAQDEAKADYTVRFGPEEGLKKYEEDINNVRAAASIPGDVPGIAVGLATAGLGAGIGIIRNAKAANQARKGISIIERGKELNSVRTALVADAAKLSDEAAAVSSQLDDAVRIGATEKATELSNKLNGLTSQLAPLQSRIGIVDDGIKNVSDAANKIEIGIDTMKTAGDATRAVASGATRGMANGAEFIGEKAAGLNKFLRRIEGNFMRGRLPWLIHTALAIPLGKVYGSYVATRIGLMAAPPILRKMSNFGRVMSEEMLERTSSTPFFRRVAANESIGGLGRAVATLGDYSTPIAKGVASMAKGTAKALPATLSYNAINSQGLDENSLKYAARDAFIFGSLGRLIGGKKDMNQVNSDQMFNYRNKLDSEQAAAFDGLKDRDFRYALSGIDAAYPGVFKWELKTSGNNKFDPASSKAVVNLNDKAGFLKEVAMHEAGHMIQHVWQKDGTIVSRMLGDGTQPGLVRNTDGTLDPEFKAWSDEYNKLRIDNDMAPADLNELAIEYYTDQGVQTLLNDTLKGNLYKESRKTPLRRSVEGSFRTLFNAAPIVKNLHFKMGGATDASGRMVMGTGLLADGFRELPEVKSMIRQMYRETAGKPKLGQRPKIVDVASDNPKHYQSTSVIDRVNKEIVDRGEKLQDGVLIPDKNGNGEGILTDAHLKALEESGAIDNGEFGKSLLLQTEMDNPQKHGILLVNKPVNQGRSEQFGGLAEGYVVPTKWLLRKGRLYLEAMDLRQLDKNVDRAIKNKIANELGLTRKQILEDIEKSVEIQNKGASSDSYYQSVDPKRWQRRKNFINSVIGLQTKRQLDINPMMRKVSPDTVTGVYRTFAFDRLQNAIQTTGDVVIPFGQNSYYSIRDNLMPQSPRVNRNGELVTEPVQVKGVRYMPENKMIHEATGLPLNQDGTVTVYHGTTKAGAESIRKTKVIRSAAEPDVYFTTEPTSENTGYGDGTVVAIKIDPQKLILDDEFPDGRKDFRVEVGKSKQIKVDLEPKVNKAIASNYPKSKILFYDPTGTLFKKQTKNEIQQGYSNRFNNPVTLKDETRLSGFADPLRQTTFHGYDKNGEKITIRVENVNPLDIVFSKDNNKTANLLKERLKERQKSLAQ